MYDPYKPNCDSSVTDAQEALIINICDEYSLFIPEAMEMAGLDDKEILNKHDASILIDSLLDYRRAVEASRPRWNPW